MSDGIEIRGGAGEFEAAVIAVVLDHLAHEERVAREGGPKPQAEMSAWMRAIQTEDVEFPVDSSEAI